MAFIILHKNISEKTVEPEVAEYIHVDHMPALSITQRPLYIILSKWIFLQIIYFDKVYCSGSCLYTRHSIHILSKRQNLQSSKSSAWLLKCPFYLKWLLGFT